MEALEDFAKQFRRAYDGKLYSREEFDEHYGINSAKYWRDAELPLKVIEQMKSLIASTQGR